jgi:soluble lytic murein transglycosylase-like protein
MQIPTEQIMARITAIQSRIDSLTDTPQAVSTNFASTLQSASADSRAVSGGMPIISPDGQMVRPLSLSDTNVAQYNNEISSAASKYGIDPKLIEAVMEVESGGNPRAVSRSGAMGLMQLMPSNVAEAGVTDAFDPTQNIDAGAKQLSDLLTRFGGNIDLTLAGYNAGPNAVARYGGIPPYPETQNYVRKVRAAMDSL